MSTFDLLAEELLTVVARTLRARPTLLTELRTLLQPKPAPVEAEHTYVTVAEYAARLRLSKRTVETLIRDGLPIVGRGRRRRIPVVEADQWMKTVRGTNAIETRARSDVRRAAKARVSVG